MRRLAIVTAVAFGMTVGGVAAQPPAQPPAGEGRPSAPSDSRTSEFTAPAPGQPGSPLPAPAAQAPLDPARMAMARRMVNASLMDGPTFEMIVQVGSTAMEAEMSRNPGFREEWREPMLRAFREEVIANRGGFLEGFAEIYARRYTEAQLREVVAFYESPTGRMMTADQPELMREGALVGQNMMSRLMPGFERRLERYLPSAVGDPVA